MDMKKLIEAMDRFAGEPRQKVADQVRGTDVAKKRKDHKHPFLHRLVGEIKDTEIERKLSEQYEQFKLDENEGAGDYIIWVNSVPQLKFSNKSEAMQEFQKLKSRWPTDEIKLKQEINTSKDIAESYPERDGLDGPFTMKNGKTVYYDSKKKEYIDADQSLEEYGAIGTTNASTPVQPGQSNQQIAGQQTTDMINNTNQSGPGTANQLKNQQQAAKQQQQQQQQELSPQVASKVAATTLATVAGIKNPQVLQFDQQKTTNLARNINQLLQQQKNKPTPGVQ